jgi:ATP-dependent RNA helicase DDX55/SPB4
VLGDVKKEMMRNRDLFDKAQTAFVSYIRGYKEHVLSYIFRFSKIDYGKLATGFGLIQV